MDTFSLSGWLLADLLLGLAVLFLIGNTTVPPQTTATPTVSPTATPLPPTSTSDALVTPAVGLVTPAPTPLPTATPQTALSMDAITYEFSIDIPEDRLRGDLGALLGEQQPGFVMVFGAAPEPQQGDQLARIAEEILRQTLPEKFPEGVTVMEPLHFITGSPDAYGMVQLKIFVFTQYVDSDQQ